MLKSRVILVVCKEKHVGVFNEFVNFDFKWKFIRFKTWHLPWDS